MANLVTLSKASRLLGVTRAELQKQIKKGLLSTFEGELDLADLRRVYPHARLEDTAMLEQVQRIKEQAVAKHARQQISPDPEQLMIQFVALRNELVATKAQLSKHAEQLEDQGKELAEARAQSEDYLRVIARLRDKLQDTQDACDQRHRVLVEAVTSWLVKTMKGRW